MHAQVADSVHISGAKYDICGVKGEGLFDPDRFGIETSAPHTACWRGFICSYAVTEGRLVLDALQLWSNPIRLQRNRQALERVFGNRLDLDNEHRRVDARRLAHRVLFTGGLLVGADLVDDYTVHMGFHPAYTYRHVLELTFETGQLLSQTDRSMEMEEIRLRRAHGDDLPSREVVRWINDCFRIDR